MGHLRLLQRHLRVLLGLHRREVPAPDRPRLNGASDVARSEKLHLLKSPTHMRYTTHWASTKHKRRYDRAETRIVTSTSTSTSSSTSAAAFAFFFRPPAGGVHVA